MERIYGSAVFILGTAILWEGRHLAFGSLRNPGSGMFPDLIAAAMLVLSLLLIMFPPKKQGGEQPFRPQSLVRISAVFASLLLYSLFLETLGFLIVSFLLTTILFIAFGSRKYWVAVLRAFMLTGFAYLLFEVLLKSNLPKGVLSF